MHVLIMPHSKHYLAFTALMYLLAVTRSVQPEHEVSTDKPRRYAPWSIQEEQLVWCLWTAQDQGSQRTKSSDARTFKEIADLVQRTPQSIETKITALQPVNRQPRLETLPKSHVPIIQEDIKLLKNWKEPYDPDALAWRYGKPLDRTSWTASEQPTLRVVKVEPEEMETNVSSSVSQDAHTAWRDAVNAANATWVDLAVQLCGERDSLILYTGADPHGARLTALRSALKRHSINSKPVPRQRVRCATPDVLAKLEILPPDVVLLYEPEQWSPQAVQALKARTVIVVVPSLPAQKPARSTNRSANSRGDEQLPSSIQGPSWKPRTRLDQKPQEDFLHEFGLGRVVEYIAQRGIPNTSGTAARIDWPALQHLPCTGQVIAANELLLLRAAVWYQLSTGLTPKVPDPEMLTPRQSKGNRNQASAIKPNTTTVALPASSAEDIRQRLLLDLDAHRPSKDSNLSLAVSDRSPVVYIGR